MKAGSLFAICLLSVALPTAVLADGVFLVTSQSGGRDGEVAKYDATTGAFLEIIVGPLADYRPRGATIGPDGLLYLSVLNDFSNADSKILRYDLDGNFVDEFVGAGSRADGKLGNPDGLGVASPLRFGPDGNLYVIANSGTSDEIIRFDGRTGDYLGPVVNSIVSPTEFVFGVDGLLYVSVSAANSIPSSIQRFDVATGQRVDVFVPSGSGGLNVPNSMAFGSDGDLYVTGSGDDVFRFDGDTGAFIEIFANSSGLSDPAYFGSDGVVFGPDGSLYSAVHYLGGLGGVVRYDGISGEVVNLLIEAGSGGLGGGVRGKDMLFVDTGCSRYSDGGLRNRCFVPVMTTVEIDIKPGKTPNAINPTSGQKIPVAVLATEDFDATLIDPLSVMFGPSEATEFHEMGHLKDVDEDGLTDVLFHFNTQETGIACGDTEAMLTGELYTGEAIAGTDAIVTVNCR